MPEPTLSDLMDFMKNGFGRIEVRLDGLETRAAGIETRLDRLETRLDRLEERMDGLETRMDGLESRLDRLEARVGAIEAHVQAIDDWRKEQPDLRLMLANTKITHDKIVDIESELRMMRSAINDHARENVTPGEVESIHHDLAALSKSQLEVAGRVLRIEEALHLPRV